MRIAIVFSSPTPSTNEFENIWVKCPQSRLLEPGTVIIEGSEWKIYVFNGLAKHYHRDEWNFNKLTQEILIIASRHPNSPIGIFFHGNAKKLKSLSERTDKLSIQDLFIRHYRSAEGKIYREIVKPFSSGASNEHFEKLWAKLVDTGKEVTNPCDIGEDLYFIWHKSSGYTRNLQMIIEDAETDIRHLQRCNKVDFDLLCKKFAGISVKLKTCPVDGVDDISSELGVVCSMLKDLQHEGLSTNAALILAQSCLVKINAITDALKKYWEVCHG
jgi:hypothetical protein